MFKRAGIYRFYAGALIKLKDKLSEDFLLINGDIIFNVDFNRFIKFHKAHGGLITLFTHPNTHPYDSGLIIADENKVVSKWLSKEDCRPEWFQNRVNAGLHVVNPKVLDMFEIIPKENDKKADENGKIRKIDLDRDILQPLCGTGKMFCYDSPEYVKDMGTPDRYEMVCKDMQAGIIQAKSFKIKQKAFFLDRDGTINTYVGFLKDADQFQLEPDVAKAIKMINASGFLTIVVTNQPVIARGDVTFDEMRIIHNKMETLLAREGAYLDGIYFCPHHSDKGYEGEVAELKMDCMCRKPKPGLLIMAAKDLNIDLRQSWMIGDREEDITAGIAAGCKTALVNSEHNFNADLTEKSLYNVVKNILEDI